MLGRHDNPPMLPPGVEGISELSGSWWVAHTKSRFEKAFAWNLLSMRIGYFLPMIERLRIFGGRKRRVLLPLFAGYVFFCGRQEHRYEAMRTNRLCRVIEVADQERLVEELANLERGIMGKAELDFYPFAAVGERCRVTAGPFRGLEGIVVSRRKQAVLVLEVSILGQGASVQISCDLVEPVGRIRSTESR